jgi:D-apionate oxidoisomerase
MRKTVAIVGAGGKMGSRAVEKIERVSRYQVLLSERDPARAAFLESTGHQVTELEEAVSQADFIVLAVPDELIGSISHLIVPQMKSGGALIALDAAAAYVGEIPTRADITQMIAHPCHPPLFVEQDPKQGSRDYFGGVAIQDILVALVDGSESVFQEGIELSTAMFAPVGKSHRVTIDEFALLEPAMSEIVVATAAMLMKASLDAAIERGVPREAAEAFMSGHAQIAIAIAFGIETAPFSDAAKVAIQWGMDEIIQPHWKRVFEQDTLHRAIQVMLHPDGRLTTPSSLNSSAMSEDARRPRAPR